MIRLLSELVVDFVGQDEETLERIAKECARVSGCIVYVEDHGWQPGENKKVIRVSTDQDKDGNPVVAQGDPWIALVFLRRVSDEADASAAVKLAGEVGARLAQP